MRCIASYAHGRTPMSRLTTFAALQLEISGYMRELQEVVNAARSTSPVYREFHQHGVRYHLGRLHGCIFTARTLLITLGGYDEMAEWSDALMNEADFLAYNYLLPEAMREYAEEIPA